MQQHVGGLACLMRGGGVAGGGEGVGERGKEWVSGREETKGERRE